MDLPMYLLSTLKVPDYKMLVTLIIGLSKQIAKENIHFFEKS